MFYLETRANQHWDFSGLDTLELCYNRAHFNNYPHTVKYNYNSLGFRDAEWPSESELSNCIWCFGDSFTVGLGSPIEHTWPYILQQKTGIRTINVSMDGASNQWIARHAREAIKRYNPGTVIINWSYMLRSELPDETLSDEDRRTQSVYNERSLHSVYNTYLNIISEFKNVVNTSIPGVLERKEWQAMVDEALSHVDSVYDLPHPDEVLMHQRLLAETEHFVEYEQLDYARDYHHFDVKTATHLVDLLLEQI